MSKISNSFLRQFVSLSSENPWFNMEDCCRALNMNPATVNGWKRSLKSKKWKAGYKKTEDNQPLNQECIDLFLDISFKKTSISIDILQRIIDHSTSNPTFSLEKCCRDLNLNYTTCASWYKNFQKGKWSAGFNNTTDGKAIDQQIIDSFLNCFVYSIKLNKILFRLIKPAMLKDKKSLAIQKNCLKSILEKYPNLDFWLSVDLGNKLNHINNYLKYFKSSIDKKYIEFTSCEDNYSKFEYKYEPKKNNNPKNKKKKNIWDFY